MEKPSCLYFNCQKEATNFFKYKEEYLIMFNDYEYDLENKYMYYCDKCIQLCANVKSEYAMESSYNEWLVSRVMSI